MKKEDSVRLWISSNKAQIIKDLTSVLRIESVSDASSAVKPYGQPCIDVLEAALSMARAYGFKTENYDNQCGCVMFPSENPLAKTVGLWTHLDIVPAGDNWDFPPFAGTVMNNTMISRGIEDNKGSAIAGLHLLRAVKELGIPLKYNLRLYFGTNEECGMADIKYFVSHYSCPDLSIIPDTEFPVCFAEKGIIECNLVSDTAFSSDVIAFEGGTVSNVVPDFCRLTLRKSEELLKKTAQLPDFLTVETGDQITITAHGISRHAAFPEGGVNAIHLITSALRKTNFLSSSDMRLVSFLNEVNQDTAGTGLGIAGSDELSGALTCVGSIITLKDGHPVLSVNIRYPVTGCDGDLLGKIDAACIQAGFSCEVGLNSKPNLFPRSHPVVDAFTQVYNEMTGQSTQPYVMGGGTYARCLPNAFAFGLGIPDRVQPDFIRKDHGGAHQPDEFVNLDDLYLGMNILAGALLRLNDLEF